MNMYLDIVSHLCDGLETPNTSTKEFISKVATNWANMAARHHLTLEPYVDAQDALQALAHLIDNTSPAGDNIEDHLGTPISFGAFKEVYEWTDKYVIKFCAERNPTLEEQTTLFRAEEHNTSHFFVPSVYLQLPRAVDSLLLDKEDDDEMTYDSETHSWTPNPDWVDNTRLVYICIQPRIAPLPDTDQTAHQFSNHEGDWRDMVAAIPQLAGEERREWYILAGTCLEWLADFAHYYGKAGLVALRDFAETFGIWDLHAENVGNLIPSVSGRGAPVILDWMSR